MPAPKQQRGPSRDFAHKSDIESICLHCYLSVRAKAPDKMRAAEDLHRRLCPTCPRLPTRF
jgi:hypothetical protein